MNQKNSHLRDNETLALQVVQFLAGDADRLGRFLALSGIAPADLKNTLNEPAFLGGVLDYLLGDETLLQEFCANAGVSPEQPARARRALPGAGGE